MNQDAGESSVLYRPLDVARNEIRLLRVEPNLKDGRISCHLSDRSLTSAHYVVLSYRWGADNADHEIILNGKSVHVRSNLISFLQVIRQQKDMCLWIDALCINQSDLEERSGQVSIMGKIFQNAAMVISWLGDDPRVCAALWLMEKVWSSSVAGDDSDRLPCVNTEMSEEGHWHTIAELCSLLYWDRAWVVQEVLLSSNNYLLCGTKTLPWQAFANFMSLVDVRFQCPLALAAHIHNSTAKSYAVSKPYAMVPESMQWSIGNELKHDSGRAWDDRQYNLFRAITMFGDRACTDPLDHVYAVLSLTAEGKHFPVRYGIHATQLLLTTFHFCGQSAQQEQNPDSNGEQAGVYLPKAQRALIRNAKFLAETLGLVPIHHAQNRTAPYFLGQTAGADARGPNPTPDPCFPQADQCFLLKCSLIDTGNEPPVLRSKTLKRAIDGVEFDCFVHIDESSSWLMCRRNDTDSLFVVSVITIKDGPQGRGFRLLPPAGLGRLRLNTDTWKLLIGPEYHMDFLKIVVLGVDPT